MRKPLLLIIFFACSTLSKAQLNTSIRFDNYVSATSNDLSDHFTGSHNFMQSQTGGITGGAVSLPAPGAGAASYNRVLTINAWRTTASLCFKFNRTILNGTDGGGDALQLSFVGANALDYVRFLVRDAGVAIQVPGSVSFHTYPNGARLSDLHWYQLKTELATAAGQPGRLITALYVYDLGTTGLQTPVLIQAITGEEVVSPLTDNMASVQIFGEQRGGAEYLDNFMVSGQTTGVSSTAIGSTISMPSIVTGDALQVHSTYAAALDYAIFGIDGRELTRGRMSGTASLNLAAAPAGTYTVRFAAAGTFCTRRFTRL